MNKEEKIFLNGDFIVESKQDWRQKLAYEKFEYKKQMDYIKIQDKIKKETYKRDAEIGILIGKIAMMIVCGGLFITFAPFLIGGLLFITFISVLAKR